MEIPVVTIETVSGDKIYAMKISGVFLLTGRNGENYYWHCMNKTNTQECPYDNIPSAIESAWEMGETVYEFDNLKEFAEWLVKETK